MPVVVDLLFSSSSRSLAPFSCACFRWTEVRASCAIRLIHAAVKHLNFEDRDLIIFPSFNSFVFVSSVIRLNFALFPLESGRIQLIRGSSYEQYST